jgi:small subunit ribosomal protein S20
MANHPSALKRHRQGEKRQTRNRWWKSRVRTATKAVITAAEKKRKQEASEALTKAMSEIDRACTKGAIHRSTASRKVARLSKLVASL